MAKRPATGSGARAGARTGGMSLRAYARSRGLSHVTVVQAIREGRLVKSVAATPRGPKITDAAIADREWAATRDAAKVRQPPPASAFDPGSLTDARRRLVTAKALATEIEVRRKAGRLIDVDAVKRDAFEVARTVRDTLLILPDRLAAELAAETDPARVHARLDAEIRQALEALAGG